MKNQLNKKIIERFSRQIVLKDIGSLGQKKILFSKVLIVGAGGLGSPVAEFLSRVGVGSIGIVDNDRVSLSNLHRQSLYLTRDIGKPKVKINTLSFAPGILREIFSEDWLDQDNFFVKNKLN